MALFYFLLFTMIIMSEVFQKIICHKWWKLPHLSHMWRVLQMVVWSFDSQVRETSERGDPTFSVKSAE